jgi:glycerol-3-phosphate dehydrogenase
MFSCLLTPCPGLYGDEVEQMKHCGLGTHYGSCDPKSIIPVSPFVVTPRKGQFVVFRPKANLPHDIKNVSWRAPNMIIEPVPTIRTKGVILWQTVYGTVVVGPTATDQKSKDDRSTDMATLQELIAHGKRVMPGLEHWEVIGSYSGLRPSTEHR